MRVMHVLVLLGTLASPSIGAEPVPAKHPFTVDDMWAVKRVGAPVVSPDGSLVAYTVSTWDAEENRSNADIWVIPVAGGPARRLTTSKASDTSVAFSPDVKRIAFVSKRESDAVAQVYVLSLGGGEAERITERPTAVSNPKWIGDGR
ncbi:MAG TPA: S9 family peptidase, partial [Vicinamibacteria bacterium]|nr:S9 family peptidase [Vicinamibacteria bacterium]